MKTLIGTHKEAIQKYTNLDLPTIEKATYLHDFDREVQYVVPHASNDVLTANYVLGAQLGDILQRMLTTVMRLQRMRY